MRSDRELEEMIDAAIPGYSQVDPPAGLEQRVLARSLASSPIGERSVRRFAWQWSLAIPAIACLLIVLFLTGRRSRPPQIPVSTAKNISTTPAPTAAVVPTSPERHNARIPSRSLPLQGARTPQPLPKQDVFPSPSPLTSEEAAMVALTRAQGPISPQIADNEAEVKIPEVRIAELEIKPLPTLADQRLGPSAALTPLISQQP